MLEQSITTELLLEIYDDMNKSGCFSDNVMHPSLKKINARIQVRRKALKNFKVKNCKYHKYPKKVQDKYDVLRNNLDNQYKNKREALKFLLENIAKKIRSDSFRISYSEILIKGKKSYRCKESPESIYCLKAISRHIRKLYKIKPSSRDSINIQIKNYLDDGFGYDLLRTDIKSFFESISHDVLINILKSKGLLSQHSMKIIRRLLSDHERKTGLRIGIPRGLSISSDLAEIYMAKIDSQIKSIEGVVFYARYVDDIIVIRAPNFATKGLDILNVIEKICEGNQLSLNEAKTHNYKWNSGASSSKINYLGFTYFLHKNRGKVDISTDRFNRYKKRIDQCFEIFNNRGNLRQKEASKWLVRRIKFLTTNTRLDFSKENAHTGIFFNNSLISDNSKQIQNLDKYLQSKIKAIDDDHKWLKSTLGNLTFETGFSARTFSSFTSARNGKRANMLKKITDTWKYD